MGIVYEAEHESLKSRVALKVMHLRFRADRTSLRRFQTEARSAAELHHTNIVPVFDFGEHDGICYYAMQYIAGSGLERVLEDVRRLRAAAGVAGRWRRGCDETRQGAECRRGRLPRPADRPVRGRRDGCRRHRVGSRRRPGVGATRLRSIAADAEGHPVPAATGRRDGGRAAARSPASRSRSTFARWPGWGPRWPTRWTTPTARGSSTATSSRPTCCSTPRATSGSTDFGLAKLVEGEDLSQLARPGRHAAVHGPGAVPGRDRPPRRHLRAWARRSTSCWPCGRRSTSADQAQLIDQIAHQPPTPLRQHDRRIPRDLETIVLKALAKDPKDRFATARRSCGTSCGGSWRAGRSGRGRSAPRGAALALVQAEPRWSPG